MNALVYGLLLLYMVTSLHGRIETTLRAKLQDEKYEELATKISDKQIELAVVLSSLTVGLIFHSIFLGVLNFVLAL